MPRIENGELVSPYPEPVAKTPLEVLESGGFPNSDNSTYNPDAPTFQVTPDVGVNVDPFTPEVGVQVEY